MRKPLFAFLFISLVTCSNAQSHMGDTSAGYMTSNLAIEDYQHSMGMSSPLYNGIVHTGYLPSIIGFSYFLSNEWQKGVVLYDDILYKDVSMKYDMVADQLIIKRLDGFGLYLFSPRVKYFSFSGHTFIYIHQNKEIQSVPAGFYDQLQSGKITLLVKRGKTIFENITNIVERKFIEDSRYYIIKDSVFHQIKNMNSIMVLTADKKREIRTHLKKYKLKFKKNPEETLVRVAEYYNQ